MAPSSEMPLPLGRTPSPIRSPPTESSADRTTTDVGITKDAELWFTDGNIVLLSSGTASCGQVAFRVYKGILSRASPVFQDLFEHAVAPPETVDPAPLAYVADEPEFVDGCPTVKVTDSSIEMRHFLRAIFQSGTTSLSLSYNKTRQPFAHLAAIARLAHKYQADVLAAAAFERIEMFFTARQNLWSKLKSAYDYQEGLEIRGSQYALLLRPEDAVEAVNLARLFEKPLMLPLALYMCCVLDPQVMRNGIAREDGTLDRLSDDDFARCIGACLIMVKEGYHHLKQTIEGMPGPSCTSEKRCVESAEPEDGTRAVWKYPFLLTHAFLRADKRGLLDSYIGPQDCLQWACAACRNQRLRKSTTMAQAAWRELPSWLGIKNLPGW